MFYCLLSPKRSGYHRIVYKGYPLNVRTWVNRVVGIAGGTLRVFLVGPLLHSILLLELDVVRFSTRCGTSTVFDIDNLERYIGTVC